MPVPDAKAVLEVLGQVFPVKAEVRKTREIYRFQGVQVHLDTVKGLGKFLEFEKVLADESERDEGRKHLAFELSGRTRLIWGRGHSTSRRVRSFLPLMTSACNSIQW